MADPAWKEVDLLPFIKRHFTLASIASLFGTKILDREGGKKIYNSLWDFDLYVATLLIKLRDWSARKAARSRDAGIERLVRWERAAKEAKNKGLVQPG